MQFLPSNRASFCCRNRCQGSLNPDKVLYLCDTQHCDAHAHHYDYAGHNCDAQHFDSYILDVQQCNAHNYAAHNSDAHICDAHICDAYICDPHHKGGLCWAYSRALLYQGLI